MAAPDDGDSASAKVEDALKKLRTLAFGEGVTSTLDDNALDQALISMDARSCATAVDIILHLLEELTRNGAPPLVPFEKSKTKQQQQEEKVYDRLHAVAEYALTLITKCRDGCEALECDRRENAILGLAAKCASAHHANGRALVLLSRTGSLNSHYSSYLTKATHYLTVSSDTRPQILSKGVAEKRINSIVSSMNTVPSQAFTKREIQVDILNFFHDIGDERRNAISNALKESGEPALMSPQRALTLIKTPSSPLSPEKWENNSKLPKQIRNVVTSYLIRKFNVLSYCFDSPLVRINDKLASAFGSLQAFFGTNWPIYATVGSWNMLQSTKTELLPLKVDSLLRLIESSGWSLVALQEVPKSLKGNLDKHLQQLPGAWKAIGLGLEIGLRPKPETGTSASPASASPQRADSVPSSECAAIVYNSNVWSPMVEPLIVCSTDGGRSLLPLERAPLFMRFKSIASTESPMLCIISVHMSSSSTNAPAEVIQLARIISWLEDNNYIFSGDVVVIAGDFNLSTRPEGKPPPANAWDALFQINFKVALRDGKPTNLHEIGARDAMEYDNALVRYSARRFKVSGEPLDVFDEDWQEWEALQSALLESLVKGSSLTHTDVILRHAASLQASACKPLHDRADMSSAPRTFPTFPTFPIRPVSGLALAYMRDAFWKAVDQVYSNHRPITVQIRLEPDAAAAVSTVAMAPTTNLSVTPQVATGSCSSSDTAAIGSRRDKNEAVLSSVSSPAGVASASCESPPSSSSGSDGTSDDNGAGAGDGSSPATPKRNLYASELAELER